MSKTELVKKRPLGGEERTALEILRTLESGQLTTLVEIQFRISPDIFVKRIQKHIATLVDHGFIVRSPGFYRISAQGRMYESLLLRKLEEDV